MSTITVYEYVGWPTTIDQPDLIMGWGDGTLMAWSSTEETTEFPLGRIARERTPLEATLAPVSTGRPANAVTGRRNSPIMKRKSSDRGGWR